MHFAIFIRYVSISSWGTWRPCQNHVLRNIAEKPYSSATNKMKAIIRVYLYDVDFYWSYLLSNHVKICPNKLRHIAKAWILFCKGRL